MIILVVLIVIPLIEIALFIKIGGLIGLSPTIGCIILTAAIGAILIRFQGLSVIDRPRRSRARGEIPVDALIDAGCLLVAGLLLLIPGFLTDALGFSLFVPPLRRHIGHGLWSRLRRHGVIDRQGQSVRPPATAPDPDDRSPGAAVETVDAEYEEIPPSDDSPWHKEADKRA